MEDDLKKRLETHTLTFEYNEYQFICYVCTVCSILIDEYVPNNEIYFSTNGLNGAWKSANTICQFEFYKYEQLATCEEVLLKNIIE